MNLHVQFLHLLQWNIYLEDGESRYVYKCKFEIVNRLHLLMESIDPNPL